MANTLQIKRGGNLSNAGTPAEGELVYKTGTNELFVGDGSTAATSLTAIGGAAAQNLFSTIAVSGQSNVVSDATSDTLTLVGGSNVTITTNAGSDTITFAATNTNTTYTAGDGLALDGTEFNVDISPLTLDTTPQPNDLLIYEDSITGDIKKTRVGVVGADTNTTYTAGTNLTLDGTEFDVDDAFLKNNASDTTSGTITAAGYVSTGGVQLAGELDFTGNGNKYVDVYTLASSNTFRIRHHNPSGNVFHDALVLTGNAGAKLYHNNGLKFQTTSAGATLTGQLSITDTNANIYRNSNDLELKTYGGFDINLMPAGSVGIGTTAPADKLHVYGTSGTTQLRIETTADAGAQIRYKNDAQSWINGINLNNQYAWYSSELSATVGMFHVDGYFYSNYGIRLSTNNTFLYGRDSDGDLVGLLGLHSNNNCYVGPKDNAYAGGYMLYGAASAMNGHVWYEGNAERMRIADNGFVGIGTNSPAHSLHVYHTANYEALKIETNGGGALMRATDSTGTTETGTQGGAWVARTASTARLTINQAGAAVFGGTVNATSFHGDGSNLTGVSGAVSAVANGSNNRIATFSSSTALNGEANLTFDGNHLDITSGHLVLPYGEINDANSDVNIASTNTLVLNTGGSNRYLINNSGSHSIYGNTSFSSPMSCNYGAVFNEASNDSDFRVESNGNTHALFVDAGNDKVGILKSSPAYTLDVAGDIQFQTGNAIWRGGQRHTIGSYSASAQTGRWQPIVASVRNSGRMIHPDEDFNYGSNSVSAYNNAGGGHVAVSRVTASSESLDAPNSSGYVMKIVSAGSAASPGYGGFYQLFTSEASHTFVQIFQAKIPTGYRCRIAENARGNNATSYWLTPREGTGQWEWYCRVANSGNGGSFGTSGHIYLDNGTDASHTWYLASCTAYDVSESPGNYTSSDGIYGSPYGVDLNLRRGSNNDDRVVVEASQTRIIGDSVERCKFGSWGMRMQNDNYAYATGIDNDFTMSHNGTNSYLQNYTGTMFLRCPSNKTMVFDDNNGVEHLNIDMNSDVVVNQGGGNIDFRVEGDTNQNLLFVDASTDRVGIGTSSPGHLFQVQSTTLYQAAIAYDASTKLKISVESSGKSRFYTDNNAICDFISGLCVQPTKRVYLDGGLDTYIHESSGNVIEMYTGGARRFQLTTSYLQVPDGNKIGAGNDNDIFIRHDGNGHLQSNTGTMFINQVANGSMIFSTNNTERIRIEGGGDVGIGTTNPGYKLDVNDASAGIIAQFQYGSDTDGRIQIYADANAGSIGNDSGLAGETIYFQDDVGQRFYTGGSERMRIDTSGNVGIGTSSPSTPLQVAGIVQIVESGNSAFYGGNYVRMFSAQNYSFRNTGGSVRAQIGVTHGDLSLYNSSGTVTNLLQTNGVSYLNGGNVGIGTTAPGSLLTVYKDGTQVSSPSTSYQIMTVSNSNGGIAIQAGASSDAFLVFGDYGQYDAGRIRYHNSTHYMDFCTGGNNPRMTIKNDGKIVVNGTDSDGMFRVNSTSTENVVKIYGNAARGASRYALMIDDNDTNGRGSVYVENASGTGMKIVTQGSNYLLDLVSNNDGSNPARSCGVRMTSYEGRANGFYHQDANSSGHIWFSGNRYAGSTADWQVGYSSSGDTADYLSKARILVDRSGNFHADADVIAYSSTIGSDIKLKKNVEDIGYGLDDVLKMRAVEFDWKKKREGKHDIGVIAQELEKIIPEVVNEVKTIGEGAENGDTHKVVDYAKLTSVLIKAIQQQQVQIDELKIQIGE